MHNISTTDVRLQYERSKIKRESDKIYAINSKYSKIYIRKILVTIHNRAIEMEGNGWFKVRLGS